LLTGQRLVDATNQLDTLTKNSPNLPQAWLTLGALHVQLRQPTWVHSWDMFTPL